MKKILITGGCGFIGSHLSEFLLQKNFEISVFDRYNINDHKGLLDSSKFKKEIKFILGDIRDFDSINRAIEGQDVVVHMAALIGIPYSYVSPLAYIKTNIEGTYNVLESCRKNNVNNIINTSTSEVYGSALFTPIDENHPIQAQSPYSASKISADNLCYSYHCSFDLNVKTIRPFNTYGPRQSFRAIIPTIIGQLIGSNNKISIGNLDAVRDFTYVKDTCEAYYNLLISQNNGGEVYNVGNNKSISMNDLLSLITKITGIEKMIEISQHRIRPKKSEVNELKCNYEKFSKLTNWKPLVSLEDGIKLTSEWFLENKKFLKENEYQI